jgi:hypothetical protein
LLEEEASFPDVSVELPGVILEEEEEGDHQVVTNEPNPAFKTLALQQHWTMLESTPPRELGQP